ncbi:MAG: hypothetical protein M0023_07235 [Desulfobacteraceae bacterium]|nr:hypothetical protein [Desulfobacteraceae bacterium]
MNYLLKFIVSIIFVMISFLLSISSFANVLIQQNQLVYEGSFRVPLGNLGGASTYPQTLARGGGGLTYNAKNNSLIMISRYSEKLAVEISIPTLIISGDISKLNTANLVQVPGNIANGQWANLASDGSTIPNGGVPGGLLVYNNELIGSSWAYYDGANQATRSHFTASLNWATTGAEFNGMFSVGNPLAGIKSNGGFVGGYMALVPPDWQSKLGYPVLTGLGGTPVISRTSLGPDAWGFNPTDLGKITPVPARCFLAYTTNHPTLGNFDATSLYFNRVTQVRGLVFPVGSDSLLFFGRQGLGSTGKGDTCYGPGTSSPSQAATQTQIQAWVSANGGTNYSCGSTKMSGTEGDDCCYDAVDSSKGVHGYPYAYWVWAYDANDLLAVKLGTINPWDIKPYAIWELKLPYSSDTDPHTGPHIINGAAYDPSTQRIFISQDLADDTTNKYEPYPIIHVYKLNYSSPTVLAPQNLTVHTITQ